MKTKYPKARLIKVVNMIAVATIKGRINLIVLSYEPEIYPAILKLKDYPPIVYYRTGKVIITGGKTLKSLHQALKLFEEKTSIKEEEPEKERSLHNKI